MRVGELLLERKWVSWEALVLAIGEQPASGMRMCSFLVERGVVTFDDAARALGEQHRCAAVLMRHLERRDPELAELLPEQVARRLVALPIGRNSSGAVIVCVRDPSHHALATLAKALGKPPVLAVAPARHLERLVHAAYAPRELDPAELEELDNEPEPGVSVEIEVPIDAEPAADDVPIDVDVPAAAESRPKHRAIPVVIPMVAAVSTAPRERDSLDATLASFRTIDEPDWLFDVAMPYIEKHWESSLLLTVRDQRAVGTRGHGSRITPTLVRTCVVNVAEVAILEQACAERRIVDEPPAEVGDEDELLTRLLAGDHTPIAAPIVHGDCVKFVLLVSEPVGAGREDALVDLGLLVEALGEALGRM
jgi:hypothetical protein